MKYMILLLLISCVPDFPVRIGYKGKLSDDCRYQLIGDDDSFIAPCDWANVGDTLVPKRSEEPKK